MAFGFTPMQGAAQYCCRCGCFWFLWLMGHEKKLGPKLFQLGIIPCQGLHWPLFEPVGWVQHNNISAKLPKKVMSYFDHPFIPLAPCQAGGIVVPLQQQSSNSSSSSSHWLLLPDDGSGWDYIRILIITLSRRMFLIWSWIWCVTRLAQICVHIFALSTYQLW